MVEAVKVRPFQVAKLDLASAAMQKFVVGQARPELRPLKLGIVNGAKLSEVGDNAQVPLRQGFASISKPAKQKLGDAQASVPFPSVPVVSPRYALQCDPFQDMDPDGVAATMQKVALGHATLSNLRYVVSVAV
jgi:hypothetical protein